MTTQQFVLEYRYQIYFTVRFLRRYYWIQFNVSSEMLNCVVVMRVALEHLITMT